MTQLLQEAFEKASQLPEDRQDLIAQMLLTVVSEDMDHLRLTDEQIAQVRTALKEAEAGNFAGDGTVEVVMPPRVQHLIQATQELSPLEQVELVSALSLTLHQATDFWQSPSLEQLVEAQKTKPVAGLDELAAEFWPEQESADDFIDFVHQQRREDKLDH